MSEEKKQKIKEYPENYCEAKKNLIFNGFNNICYVF